MLLKIYWKATAAALEHIMTSYKEKEPGCTDPQKLDNKLLKGFGSVLNRAKSF